MNYELLVLDRSYYTVSFVHPRGTSLLRSTEHLAKVLPLHLWPTQKLETTFELANIKFSRIGGLPAWEVAWKPF